MQEDNKELAKQIALEVTKNIKKHNSLFSNIKDIITLIILAVLLVFGIKLYDDFKLNTSSVKPVEDHDLTLDNNGMLGYTTADFSDAIIGSATRKSLLIVDEQEVSEVSTITKAGLLNLGIFTKNQMVTFYGKAQYVVNIQEITADDIEMDLDKNTINVYVPHAILHEVFFDASKTVFGSNENGLLAFGDIKLTSQEQNEIEQEAINKLTIAAQNEELLSKADKYATYVIRDFFENTISSMSNIYKVNVMFKEQ